ncbi:MAG: GlsB/YeaQ/YmgE family stress response membrane protein [Acidobacteriaceae bacterium]
MFTLIWEALIGLVVGALAKLVMPGKDPGGIFITMLLGVAGALLATFIGSHVGLYQEGQRAGFLMSLLGAIVILAIYRLVRGRKAAV